MKEKILQCCRELQMPVLEQALNDKERGIYYGIHPETYEPICFQRDVLHSGTGFVLGTPGVGVDWAVKQEILQRLFSSDDEVIVVDLYGVFRGLAREIGGEVIQVGTSEGHGLNPLSWYPDADDEWIIETKAYFLIALFDIILNEPEGLTPATKSLIHRCVSNLYQKKSNQDLLSVSLYDFYEELVRQAGLEAEKLRCAMSIYLERFHLFSKDSGVTFSNRLTVFDLSNSGASFHNLNLHAVTETVWNYVMNTHKTRRDNNYQKIWLYFNDMNGFFHSEESAEYIRSLSKRCRREGCVFTFVSKQLSKLLNNDIARTMIRNSGFLQMFYQETEIREVLASLLAIDSNVLAFLSHEEVGLGLIWAEEYRNNGMLDYIPFQILMSKNKSYFYRL